MIKKHVLACVLAYLSVSQGLGAAPVMEERPNAEPKSVEPSVKRAEPSGVVGTAPKNRTVSYIGIDVQEEANGPATFLYWSQTLSNGLFYEGRVYWKYVLDTQVPPFSTISVDKVHPFQGYKGTGMLGYNIHINALYQLTPFIRFDAGRDMSFAYEDSAGDYLHSTEQALLVGVKQTFKVSANFSPYVSLYGGVDQVHLAGNFIAGPTPNQLTKGFLQQSLFYTELGFVYKITDHQALAPVLFWVYRIPFVPTNSIAGAPYAQGGFNISTLSASSQIYALKYSYFW